jgi:hypothetical protein
MMDGNKCNEEKQKLKVECIVSKRVRLIMTFLNLC